MAPKPLKVLRKGLARFQEMIKTHKNELTAKLVRAETISSLDELSTPWSQPLTMSKGLDTWAKMERHL